MSQDQTRFDTILNALVEEFSGDGFEILTAEGELYARIVAEEPNRSTVMMDLNLNTLARQIDRRMK